MRRFFAFKGFLVLFLMITVFHPVHLLSQSGKFPLHPYVLPPVFDGQFPNDTIMKFSLPEILYVKREPLLLESNVRLSILTPKQDFIERLQKNAFRNYLRHNISAIKYTKSDFSGKVERVEQIRSNIFDHLFTVEPNYDQNFSIRPERYASKRRYWMIQWNNLMQFSQNYISKNWHKGGIGNLNLLSVQKVTANYQKDKMQFNNLLEWRLSFYTNPNDTLRAFRLGEDLLRTYSDFGLKAFKDKFYYSSNLEIKTKLFRNYKENSQIYTSAIFSPLEINMGIFGMKYQYNKTSPKDKYRKTSLTADLSPLSVQYTWVGDSAVLKINRYGIPADKSFLLDFGTTLNAKITFNINKQTTFNSRIKYFTNYKKVIFEMENELKISLNRYFTTRLYLYGRFDDTPTIKRDDKLGYLQLNELFSFGFDYTW